MRFSVNKQEMSKSNTPHELFLTNLIGNYFLLSIAVGELFHIYPWTIVVIPTISLLIMSYTLWHTYRSQTRESWYVMCHWQIAARHTKIFIFAQCLFFVACLLGWMAFNFGGLTKIEAIALVGGCAGLPMFMAMLFLILLETQALYQANQHQLPAWVIATYPKPGVEVTREDPQVQPNEKLLLSSCATD